MTAVRRAPAPIRLFLGRALRGNVLRPLHRAVLRRASPPEEHARFFLSGVCAVLAYEARTAGIALLAAWVVDSLLHKESKRRRGRARPLLAPLVAWTGWIKAVESSPEYRHPAYAYQTEPYVYFNVSYARNPVDAGPVVAGARPADAPRLRPAGVAERQVLAPKHRPGGEQLGDAAPRSGCRWRFSSSSASCCRCGDGSWPSCFMSCFRSPPCARRHSRSSSSVTCYRCLRSSPLRCSSCSPGWRRGAVALAAAAAVRRVGTQLGRLRRHRRPGAAGAARHVSLAAPSRRVRASRRARDVPALLLRAGRTGRLTKRWTGCIPAPRRAT